MWLARPWKRISIASPSASNATNRKRLSSPHSVTPLASLSFSVHHRFTSEVCIGAPQAGGGHVEKPVPSSEETPHFTRYRKHLGHVKIAGSSPHPGRPDHPHFCAKILFLNRLRAWPRGRHFGAARAPLGGARAFREGE